MQLLVRAATAFTASALVVAATLAPAQASVQRVPEPNRSVNPASHPGEYANRIVARINDHRQRAGLRQLRVYQTCLDNHAERWAKHLAQSGRLVHPPGDRRRPARDHRRRRVQGARRPTAAAAAAVA